MKCNSCDAKDEFIRQAVQVLGAPVTDYSPETAVGEYDAKIKRAVEFLLGGLRK